MVFRSWGLAFGAAVALLASVFVGHIAGTRMRQTHPRVIRTNGVQSAPTVFYEASTDASGLSSDEFIAVPYTPPLAQGELVRVVHADLDPDALASMGIDIDPAWAGNVPADVVVGEDGIPRAVRITEIGQN